jgi:hypothetical protein
VHASKWYADAGRSTPVTYRLLDDWQLVTQLRAKRRVAGSAHIGPLPEVSRHVHLCSQLRAKLPEFNVRFREVIEHAAFYGLPFLNYRHIEIIDATSTMASVTFSARHPVSDLMVRASQSPPTHQIANDTVADTPNTPPVSAAVVIGLSVNCA